jgi:hypothetical protein
MFENEDMILPDDFQEDTTPTEEVTENETLEPVEPVEDTKPTEPTEEPVSPFLKVKYNKEEMELDEMTARELAQKGLNYDKTIERLQALESDPRLSFVEELAQQHGMDVPQYLEAVKQQREQERIDQLVEQGISEEVAQELLESRKDREERKKEKEEAAKEQKKNADYQEFFDYFKQANDRDFNSQSDEIPQSVWDATEKGVPLKYAYMEHQNNQFKTQLTTLKQNESNAKKAPIGSVTGHGSNPVEAEDDFLAGFNSI